MGQLVRPDHLINEEALVIRRVQTGIDDTYGSPTWVETETPTRVWTHPLSAEEIQDRPAGRLTHRGYLRAGTAVGNHDRIVKATGHGFEVDGPALEWRHPVTQKLSFLTVDLIEVE